MLIISKTINLTFDHLKLTRKYDSMAIKNLTILIFGLVFSCVLFCTQLNWAEDWMELGSPCTVPIQVSPPFLLEITCQQFMHLTPYLSAVNCNAISDSINLSAVSIAPLYDNQLLFFHFKGTVSLFLI